MRISNCILLTILLNFVLIANAQESNSKFKEWAKTPPMGWNSWDCFGSSVTEAEVRSNAEYMAKHLKKYGWQYIIVDIRWYLDNETANGYNQANPQFSIDKYGRYTPAVNRFPSAKDGKGFKALADFIHSKGLKFGLHIMRGVPKIAVQRKMKIEGTNYTADQIYSTKDLCSWLNDNYTVDADKPGAQAYYNSLYRLFASWGVDFVKCDDLSAPVYHEKEIELIRHAIDNCGRAIVFSTSPGPTPVSEAENVSQNANMWRMVNDLWDNWPALSHLMMVAKKWYPYIATGTWPDCDMIPLGHISLRGENGRSRMSSLSKDEQNTLMTFFTIFRSPLFFGGNLPDNDAFTLSLLSNKDVLKMHNQSTNVRLIFQDKEKIAITSTNKKDGAIYLAIVNLKNVDQDINVQLSDLGINKSAKIYDMWHHQQMGLFASSFSKNLRPHASGLYIIKRSKR
ncbi:glycoside hydrolase family 27 protein [Arachidicoccus sp.]|uniref:glycoside hydrolase family 27 protein n=1 Tax=Arachidicoccus sp. TaxID=1872624 RepID=UPI003D1FDD1E